MALILTLLSIGCDTATGPGGGYSGGGSNGGGNGGGTGGGTGGGGSTVKLPAAPDNAWVTGLSGTSIKVTWYVVPGAEKYRIQYSTLVNGPFSSMVTSSLTQEIIAGLQPNTRYYVRVSAINSAGEGPYKSAYGSTTYGF